jgi:hypothetical protein
MDWRCSLVSRPFISRARAQTCRPAQPEGGLTPASAARGALAARPLNAEVRRRMSTPVLRQQRPALVVTPPAGNLQIPSREPFATKSEAAHKCSRRLVGGLDVCLHPMEMQLSESPAQRQREPLAHVPTTRMRNKRVVGEVGTPKRAVNDLVDVHHAHQFSRSAQDDETTVVGGLPKPLEVRPVGLRRARRRRPPPKKSPAASSRSEEARFIERGWSLQLNSHASLTTLHPRSAGRQ